MIFLNLYCCQATDLRPHNSIQLIQHGLKGWNHPGLAEIPAPVGSQEVVATPTNAHC